MSERTALEIAARLHELYYGKTGGEAVAMLRKQHAEIDRLTAERDKSIVAAVAAEREACAAVCDDLEATFPGTKNRQHAAMGSRENPREVIEMSERTALEIALDLDAASCSSFAKLEAAESLRQQHAEIERLKTVPMKYRRMAFNAQLQEENTQLSEKVERLTALNSALTAKGNAFVIENARQAEKIGRLTAEKFRRFNNEECWIYQRNGENHLGTLTCPVVISPDRMGDIVAQDGTTIAIVSPRYDGDEWAANSMLIAAAPDLLEVCRRLAEVNVFSVESEVASIIMDAVTVVRKVQEVGK